jgi:mannosyltransferase OCH1-like enzyme
MVPRLLHQYWDTGHPPLGVQSLLLTWSGMNPGWTYQLWDDASIIEFIDLHFDAETRLAYEACRFPAMRADLARYLLLWKLGGVYADSDLTCLKPLDDVIDHPASLVLFRGWNGAWRNDFMGAVPGIPIIGEFIRKAVENIMARLFPDNLWLVTGPGMTTPIISRELLNPQIVIQTFKFDDVKGKILTFNPDLEYRKGDKHWAIAQKTERIYRD